MAATIKDVARRAGVSISTVSLVFNQKGSVSHATRERVYEAAKALGYRPNSVARSLVTRRSRSVGLVIPELTDPYFLEIAKGASRTAVERGYALLLVDTDRDVQKEEAAIAALGQQQAAALILAGAGVGGSGELTQFAADGRAVVVIGRSDLPFAAVAVDNVAAGALPGAHLLTRGRRRIAYIDGPPGLTTTADRLAGLRTALSEGGVELRPDHIETGDFTLDGGYAAAKALLARITPDAVAVANDQMAIGVLKAVRECGLRVPDDVAICGIGDIPTAAFTEPPLTTVALPLRELGRRAMLSALRLTGEEAVPADDGAPLAVQLVVRAST
ncbi:MAG TPA: LacI family DNA-binding transcriptional regulator [Limnochordia bacterium]|nr:LacI family DNA-binding transcriptional regulator [Limnochordia bacterium]